MKPNAPLPNRRSEDRQVSQCAQDVAAFRMSGDDLAGCGLYLDLPAWQYHVFEVTVL